MISIKNKWALVTGASRGVGRQVAMGLAGQGCNLIVHSRDLQHTETLLKELKEKGVEACTVAGELAKEEEVERMLEAVAKSAPQIDILYNNAAIMTPYRSNPWEVPGQDYRLSFEVNVISVAKICYRLVPGMIQRGWGRVANVSSGIRNEPQLMAYAISKAALDKFVRDFVPSLEGTGVAMNLLDPGWLRTDLGGPNAPNDVTSCIPGALVPALLGKPKSGRFFCAQDYAGLSLEAALEKAEA